jgi:hypothetical protein
MADAVLIRGGETTESITLSNRIVIEVHTASFRSVRGYTIICALLDELAFWPTDEGSADPDIEVITTIRPGMATVSKGAMMLCASSPYAQRGALYDAHRRHFGKDGDPVLVWQASTRQMNPSVPQEYIDAEIERDPDHSAAKYGATFRTDVSAFVSRQVVEACVVPGRYELPYIRGTRYMAFVDPSGGSADSMTLAIAHRDKEGVAILDVLRESRPPFSPDAVSREFAQLLDAYKIHRVVGDHYAGEWPRERFRKYGIHYEPSEDFRNDLYVAVLPLLNSGRIELLDNARLVNQFCSLERKTHPSGKDTIDHQRGASGHDDLANAVAGVGWMVTRKGASVSSLITPEILERAKIPTRGPRLTDMRFGLRRPRRFNGGQKMKCFFYGVYS